MHYHILPGTLTAIQHRPNNPLDAKIAKLIDSGQAKIVDDCLIVHRLMGELVIQPDHWLVFRSGEYFALSTEAMMAMTAVELTRAKNAEAGNAHPV